MFDPPLDAPPVLVALTIVAASTLGVATTLAPTPPSDASTLAAAVDRAAASPAPTAGRHATTADAVKIEPLRIRTRDGVGEHAAIFATGRVTPVQPDSRLARVLDGDQPAAVFQTAVDLEIAARYARENPPGWQHEPAQIRVRHVTWGEVDVTLVGV